MLSTKKNLCLVMAVDSIVLILALILGTSALKNFSEAGFVTYFSFLQLVFIAWISLKIFITREGAAHPKPWKTGSFIWLIVAAGFIFLAMDETCSTHSGLDMLIHYIFRLKETPLTDRIDDFIVAAYGVLGLVILYRYRGELKEYKKTVPLFIVGYVMMFVMVGLDILSNGDDILARFISDPQRLKAVFIGVEIFEDMVKIFAEGMFVVAFLACLNVAQEKSGKVISRADKI